MKPLLNVILATLISVNLFAEPVQVDLDDVQQLETSDAKTTRIYLVRHGESIYNQRDSNGMKYTSGKSPNIPLSEKGKNQATTLGKKLHNLFPKDTPLVIASSTAKRAQDTADRLFDELIGKNTIRSKEDYEGFAELGQGNWEGKPKDDKYEEQLNIWGGKSAVNKYTLPQFSTGESYSDVANRYLANLQNIINKYPNKTIVIASHSNAMNALNVKLSGAPDNLSDKPGTPLPMLDIENCDMLLLELPVGKKIEDAKVVKFFKSKI